MKRHCASKMASIKTLYPVLLPVPDIGPGLKGREKMRCLQAWAHKALVHSAQKSGVVLTRFQKAESGAPLPESGVFWSISHKETFVAAVVAPAPVGIDVEPIRPRSEALFRKVADDREWQLTEGDKTLRFFRYWTAKEAVLKAAGDGLSGLSGCRIEAVRDENFMTIDYRGKHWDVEQYFFQGHIASITCGHFAIVWSVDEKASSFAG